MKVLRNNSTVITLMLITIFYILMAFFLPLTHDDWEWYSKYGMQMLEERFANLNGRYLGNITEIIAVRYNIVRWSTYVIICLSLLMVMVRFVGHQVSSIYYVVAFILMLIIPSAIYKQTYGWFAGFYNYVPSTVCALFIIWYVTTLLFSSQRISPIHHVLFYACCVVGQLFMENITVFHMLFLALAVVTYIILYHKLNVKLLVGLALSSIGTLIMFSNANYRKIFFEGSDYQNIPQEISFVETIYKTVTSVFTQWMFFNQIVIILIIIVLAYLLLNKSAVFQSLKTVKQWSLYIGLAILPLYYFCIYRQFELFNYQTIHIVNIVNLLICLIFVVSLGLTIHYSISSQETKFTIYVLMLTLALVSLPLVIVSPLGPRNFFTIYGIYVVILLLLVKQLHIKMHIIRSLVMAVAVILSVVFISVFRYMHYYNSERVAQLKHDIKAHPKKHSYVMERLPFENYMQHSTPKSRKYQKYFNLYWDIPENTHVKHVPFGYKKQQVQARERDVEQ